MTDSTASNIHSDVITTKTHRLHRYSALPDQPPIARVILLHGYGDHVGKHLHFLSWLADHGIAASATDFRGHGRSTGRIAYVNRWEEYLDDLHAMMNTPGGLRTEDGESRIEDRGSTTEDRTHTTENGASNVADQSLAQEPPPRSSTVDPLPSTLPPLFLLAHSHGALIAILAAIRGQLDGIAGVILTAPYLELKMRVHWATRCLGEVASIVYPALQLKSGIGGPMLTSDPDFIESNRTDPYCPGIATPRWFTTTRKIQAIAQASASQFELPLLMLVSGDDVIAEASTSVKFFEQAGSTDKQIIHYPKLRHELLREVGREDIFNTILNWMIVRQTKK